jgi:hypothetical protein
VEAREPKPARWSSERVTAFQDRSVVDRYHLRPPYPQAIIDTLEDAPGLAQEPTRGGGAWSLLRMTRMLLGQRPVPARHARGV